MLSVIGYNVSFDLIGCILFQSSSVQVLDGVLEGASRLRLLLRIIVNVVTTKEWVNPELNNVHLLQVVKMIAAVGKNPVKHIYLI